MKKKKTELTEAKAKVNVEAVVIRPKELIAEWCKKEKIELKGKPRHIHKYAYVVGYAAPLCLVVATCWIESEPQVRDFDKANPLTTMNLFDKRLKPGDWCITAYINHGGCGERIAIPLGV